MPSSELTTERETLLPGDRQKQQRGEPAFDPTTLLREGQNQNSINLPEATAQAVQQGILPELQIFNEDPTTEEGRTAPSESVAPPVEPRVAPAVEPPVEAPGIEPEAQPQVPLQRQPRRGSIQAGLAASAQAATSGADADSEAANQLPDARPTAVGEVARGFINHIVDHPLQTAGHVALGAAATAGVAIASPGLAAIATAAGGGYLVYSAGRTALDAVRSARTFNNPVGHSPEENERAQAQLREAGGNLAGLASAAGGGAGMGRLALSRLGRLALGPHLSGRLGHPGEGAVLGAEARRHAGAYAVEQAPQAAAALRSPTELVGNDTGRHPRSSAIRERLVRIAQRAH